MDSVILVNELDEEVGRSEKLAAHQYNLLHRAFSVFIFNPQSRKLLLQKRAQSKYHSRGFWSNTCCGHPRPGEMVRIAASRRLKEEMGFDAALKHIGHFRYQTPCEGGLFENEVDHIFIGWTNQDVFQFNPFEVEAIQWLDLQEVERQLCIYPKKFTPWLSLAITHIQEYLQRSQSLLQSEHFS